MNTVLGQHQSESTAQSYRRGWALLLIVLACLWLTAVSAGSALLYGQHGVLFGLGLIACWRYGWQATHGARALFYRTVVFPRLRRAVTGAPAADATHVYVVVLSFRMSSEVNAAVYSALIRDLQHYAQPATIVACVSDPSDRLQLDQLARDRKLIRLVPLQQSRLGKRDAMERALDWLVRLHPSEGSVVALIDGDTFLATGTFRATVPLLLRSDGVGAVTTDNIPLVSGSTIEREWFRLRMRARHLLMCSMSLSRRVLVLTGRFSVFRSELAFSRGFIAMLGNDVMRHSRLGDIPMLTGDDKSTWYWTLRAGWDMLYVPDVVTYCLEKPPSPKFFQSTTSLMRRYYGNMVRANARALRLGSARLGAFTWMVLLDQRLSPWTSLAGPALAILLTVGVSPAYLPAYLALAMSIRFAQTALLAGFGRGFHPAFPFLLFYNQLIGALIKIHAFFNPDKQRWTRQNTGVRVARGNARSQLLMGMSLTVFCLAILVFLLYSRTGFAAERRPAATAGGLTPCSTRLTERWALRLAPGEPASASLARLGVLRSWGAKNMRVLGTGDGASTVLDVRFPAGSINPGNPLAPVGGAGFLYPGPPDQRHSQTHACLRYELKFPVDFQFAKGGKLPGLYGGAAPAGGDDPAARGGFSLRLMWRANGIGEVYAYVAGARAQRYGESIGRGQLSFGRGEWQTIEQEVLLNRVGAAEGILRVWHDGKQVIERRDIRYRTSAAVGIDGLMFSTFFGGQDASWASPADQSLQIRNVRYLVPALGDAAVRRIPRALPTS